MNAVNEPVYLKKSAGFYKIYAGFYLLAILMKMLVSVNHNGIIDFLGNILIGLAAFPVFVMAPLGLFYSLKSYQRKEGLPKTRFIYLLGHLFFCLLILATVALLIIDISRLFQLYR